LGECAQAALNAPLAAVASVVGFFLRASKRTGEELFVPSFLGQPFCPYSFVTAMFTDDTNSTAVMT
jgi:hypothetical protein